MKIQRKKASKESKNDIRKRVAEPLQMEKKKPQNKGKIVGLGAGCLAGLGTGFYLEHNVRQYE